MCLTHFLFLLLPFAVSESSMAWNPRRMVGSSTGGGVGDVDLCSDGSESV